jgi:translocation and assembly module TamB
LQTLFATPLLPSLPAIRLPLNIHLSSLQGEDWRLTGDTELAINRFELQADVLDQQMTLTRLAIDAAQGNVDVSGKLRFNGEWPLSLTLNSSLQVAPLIGEHISLNLDGGLAGQLNAALDLSGPVQARLALQTRLMEPGLPLVLSLDSPGVQWPLTGQPQYRMNHPSLRMAGKAVDYTIDMHASLDGDGLPPAEISLNGHGGASQLTLSQLHIAALQGQADVVGLIDWREAISWRGELTLTGINTAKQWPDWPARLDGKLSLLGSLYGGNWQLRVPELNLNGAIKQNTLSASGSLSGNAAGQWQVSALRLALGRNSLSVNGSLSDTLALDAVIDAPNLDGALPGLGGTLRGQLNARGTRASPQVTANLLGAGLRWQALKIHRLTLAGDLRSSDSVRGNLNLQVDQLQQGEINVRTLTLDLAGDERAHQLRLDLQGKPIAGGLALQGGYDRQQQRWRGVLRDTHFTSPVGEWRLSPNMTIDYQQMKQIVALGPHCWQNPDASLCAPSTIQLGAGGQAVVQLNRLDLAMFKPFLPAHTIVSGVIHGRAEVGWQGGALTQARVDLTGDGIKARENLQNGALPVAFDQFTLNGGWDHDRASLDWQVSIAGNGKFNGRIQVADPLHRRGLSGNLSIDSLSLALLNPLLPEDQRVTGVLNANLRIGGTALQPQLYGLLALARVMVRGNQLPFAMTESQLNITFAGVRSTLLGAINTTHGVLTLSGDADWSRVNAWRARVNARGNRVRITLPPMIQLDASSDITLDATPQVLTLNGGINIPWARIVVKELPQSVIGVSPDEVILDDQLQPVNERTVTTRIDSNLKIHVGDDVRIDAFGLKARLQGDLNVIQDKQGLGLHGQINIPYGRFNAYAQDLIIRRGQLIFAGPPSEPLLNIEAVRNPDSTADGVTAGVRVTGLADQPRIEVFTDPVKSQQEALSYLLRGQGLNTPGADSSMMTTMLIGMGLAQSGQFMGKIGAAFGVSNLTLDTQGVGDDSQVVVSGYLTPGLQVKYGVGIYDSLATLTLRYRLMPRLYLEAVSGLNQALDLLYQFEF